MQLTEGCVVLACVTVVVWGYATVSLSTKKIKGLHENDFIMASKIDRVLDRPGRPLDRQ
jgi:4a-hydroxytetrahydrobiopterin dehydratase